MSAVRGKRRILEMKSKLLISTAVLLAGVGLATAQNMPGGGQSPAQHQGAQTQGAQGGAAGQDRERGRAGQAQQGSQEKSKQGQTTGQTPQREQGMERKGAQEKAQPQREQGMERKGAQEKAQPQRSQRERDQTTGQSPSQTQPGAQTPQRQEGQQGQQTQPPQGQMQRGQQTQPSQGQAQQGQAGGGSVTLTSEQRTQVRQTVLAGSNVPRANNVNFALTVGTAVPTSVHVVEVPTVLINIHPQWRGFFYFVVGDEIIIVDRNHHIVAVIAV
jgi:uncharacterized protein DUF1236